MRDDEGQHLRPEQLDAFAERTVRAMRRLPPAQPDVVVTKIVASDPDLVGIVPVLRATIMNARRIRMPLRRDGVS